MKRLLLALIVALLPAQGWTQAAVLQGGSFTGGHFPFYAGTGSSGQPIVIDSGTAAGGAAGVNISQLGITARGTGTAPYVAQGSGPNGELFCLYDAPITNVAGYHSLCLSPNVSSGALISYQAGGAASSQPLVFKVNGTDYQFPFTTSGIIGPGTTVVNDGLCWNNTVGTLVKTCTAATPLTIGGTNGQVQYNNAGALGGFTVGGDATLNTGTGALTVSKIGGVSVSLGGTLTTAGAFTTSGAFATTLTATGATNVTLPTTGTLATRAGNEALTNKTYNGLTITSSTGTLTITNGKTLTSSNTLSLSGTDGSTLNIGTGGTLGTAAYTASSAYIPSGTQITNSLSGDVALNNTANYFDGPSVAQGSTGTWFASGKVMLSGAAAANFLVKLWDGATVIDSALVQTTAGAPSAGGYVVVTLSGYIANPAGNIRISARDSTATTGIINFNTSGNGKDSTLSAFRVQ